MNYESTSNTETKEQTSLNSTSSKTVGDLAGSNSSSTVGPDIKKYTTLLALVVLFIVLAILTKGDFLLARNFTNLSRQISVNGILAIGMTMVILTAGIDLSIGSIVALAGVVAGLLQVNYGLAEQGLWGCFLTVAAAVFTATICGGINGALISFFKIPPFVITLGMMVIAGGLALIISNGQAISPMSSEFTAFAKGLVPVPLTWGIFAVMILAWGNFKRIQLKKFGFSGKFISLVLLEGLTIGFPLYAFVTDRGLPYPVLILAGLSFIFISVLKNLPFGRYIFAVGGNEDAAELAGISVIGTKWPVYTLMGFLSGIAAVVLTARLNSASPTVGALMELDAIAAVVIGGTSLMGGSGSIAGSLIGAMLIGTINNGMDLLEINSNYQMVIKGIIIIFAVWSDSKAKNKMKA